MGILHGIRLPNHGPIISHLLYADDVMIAGVWSLLDVRNISRILRCFHLVSGLHTNLAKCQLFGVNVASTAIQSAANILHCNIGSFPFTYLGLPVGANMNRVSSWVPVLDVFERRLSSWKASNLSLGGRITLINSVLSSLPLYFFSVFKAPVSVIEMIDKIRRNFLWGGSRDKSKIHWIRWELVLANKEDGGLGVMNLKTMNLSLLAKWWWRYLSEPNKLWRSVILAIHCNSSRRRFIPCRPSITGLWLNISRIDKAFMKSGIRLDQQFHGIPGMQSVIRFWLDVWCCNIPLAVKYPILYDLETYKSCYVSDRVQVSNYPFNPDFRFTWAWASILSDVEAIDSLVEMISLIRDASFSNCGDSWKWVGGQAGSFEVKYARELCYSRPSSVSDTKFHWFKGVPIKVNSFAWRLYHDRLPTKDNLGNRGIHLSSAHCPLCLDIAESSLHLFTSCFVASSIWHNLSEWLKIPPMIVFSVQDLFDAHLLVSSCHHKKIAFQIITRTALWVIWRACNDAVFNDKRRSVGNIMVEIKSLSLFWYNYQTKGGPILMRDWANFFI